MSRVFNKNLVLVIIASSLLFVCALVGLVYFAIPSNFFLHYEDLFNDELLPEIGTIEDIFMQLYPSIEPSLFRTVMYISYIVSGVLAMLLPIPAFVFALIFLKDRETSSEKLQNNKKLKVWLIVSLGLCYLSYNSQLGALVSTIFELMGIAGLVLTIIALIKIIKNISVLNYLAKKQAEVVEQPVVEETMTDENQDGEENLEKPEVKPVSEEDQIKLDEMYSLLSKLEKSYKNNEVSQEDYERMKKTILENYLKSNED